MPARAAVSFLAALLAACATTVRDLPPGALSYEKAGLVAGRLAFEGSGISPSLKLRSLQGRTYVVRPEHATFLVAVPPGTYRVTGFGGYRIRDDTITLQAVTGEARYVGSFLAARDANGEMRVLVRDEFADVFETLQARGDDGVLRIERGLVASALVPIGPGDLVIAVERQPRYYPWWSISVGFHHHRHGHRHHRKRRIRRGQ